MVGAFSIIFGKSVLPDVFTIYNQKKEFYILSLTNYHGSTFGLPLLFLKWKWETERSEGWSTLIKNLTIDYPHTVDFWKDLLVNVVPIIAY